MNRTVVVTGATNGTGYAIAQRFAAAGYDVCICSRNQDHATEAAAKLENEFQGRVKTFGYGLAVLAEEQIEAMFADLLEKGQAADTLVLNAANLGISMPNFFEISFNEWMVPINTNIGWNFMFARQAAKRMRELGYGAITIIGSVTAIRTIKNRSAYCTSKAGLHGMGRNLAIELAPYGIRVNTVVAGTIKTSRWHSNPQIQNSPHSKNPLMDAAEFEDVANAAFFLSSDEARFITGVELPVDGGMLAQLCYENQGITLDNNAKKD